MSEIHPSTQMVLDYPDTVGIRSAMDFYNWFSLDAAQEALVAANVIRMAERIDSTLSAENESELPRLRERATMAEIDLRGTKGALEVVSKRANDPESENARLRELVKGMRDSLGDVTAMLEAMFIASCDPEPGSIGGIARSLIAKADAILKERGHE